MPQFKPVKAVADIGPVVVPDVVDADLEGKSDFVKAEVSLRHPRATGSAANCVEQVDCSTSSGRHTMVARVPRWIARGSPVCSTGCGFEAMAAAA
jgi:hypothetical protein